MLDTVDRVASGLDTLGLVMVVMLHSNFSHTKRIVPFFSTLNATSRLVQVRN